MADAANLSLGSFWIGAPDGAATNFAVDSSTDGIAFGFQAENTDAITHLGFRYGARTGTCPTYSIRLESQDATTGFPDGTDIGGGSATAATFTPPADTTWNNTIQWVALTNPYTPTRGQFLMATIRYSSGTVDASNNSSFATHMNSGFGNTQTYPIALSLASGTWAKITNTLSVAYGYRTATARYGGFRIGSFNTAISTTGHRHAMHWTPPAGHGDTFQVGKMQLVLTTPNAANAVKFGIWNAAGTALQDIQFDSDYLASNGTRRGVEIVFDESSLATLSYGTKYYFGIEVVGSASIVLAGLQLQEAADRAMWPMSTTRGFSVWDGASWTDNDTVLPSVMPMLADITEPTGGGGGMLIHPGMGGRLAG